MNVFSVRPTLLDYLSTNKSKNVVNKSESSSFEEENTELTKSEQKTTIELDNTNCDSQQEEPSSSINKKSPKKSVPKTRSRRKLKNSSSKSLSSGKKSVRFAPTNFTNLTTFSFVEENEPLGSLQEIAAHYVIRYQPRLKSMYKTKLGQAWKLINSNLVNEDDLKKCYRTVADLNHKTKLLRSIENDNITDDLFLESNELLLKNNVLEKDPFEIPQDILIRLEDFLK